MIPRDPILESRFAAALLAGVVLVTLACDQGGAAPKGADLDLRTRIDDQIRYFRVHVPDGIRPGQAVKVVFAFHGSNDRGYRMQRGAELDGPAAEMSAVVVYPDAAVGNWAEGCDCNNADRLGIDDLGFVQAMLDTLAARWAIHPSTTFAVGYSQGGLFAHRIACELSDRFAAIATVAATMSPALASTCRPSHPVSVIMLHGTEDTVMPWEGGGSGSLALMAAPDVATFWARQSDCEAEPTTSEARLDDGATVRFHRYDACDEGRRVRLVELVGFGHTWPRGSFSAGNAVMSFFEQAGG